MEKSNVLFWGLCIALFFIFFQAYRFIFNQFIPWGGITDILSIAILILVIMPLTLIVAKKLTKFFLPNTDV